MLQMENKRVFKWRFNLAKSSRASLTTLPIDPYFWSWLAGFIDGEGSFVVAIKKKEITGIGFEVLPAIKIVQGAAKKKEMNLLAELLGKTTLIEIPDKNSINSIRGNNVCRLDIHRFQDLKAIMNMILSHLRFKKHDAEIFMSILDIIDRGGHLTIDGFLKIARLREKIASARTKPKTYRTYLWFKNYFKRRIDGGREIVGYV